MDRLFRLFDRLSILEPEDESTLSNFERRARSIVSLVFKCIVAVIFSWHVFDFLFSAVWMHGYVWCLNLPIDLDLSDKSAGSIVYHQRTMVGPIERIFHATGAVSAALILLICSGFASGAGCKVWELVKLSMTIGFVAGTVRPCQMRQRLFSSLHEGFYIEFLVFFVGLLLTLGRKQQTVEKMQTEASEEEKKEEEAKKIL